VSKSVRETFARRELLAALLVKDLQVRYRGSVLGFFWSLLTPLLMMGIFTVVFSVMLRFRTESVPYPLYVIAGYLPWMFLGSSLLAAARCLPAHENLVKKVYMPRMILPLVAVLSNLVHFVLAVAVMLIVSPVAGGKVASALLLLPAALVTQGFLVLGLALFLSALNVFYRDVVHLLEVAVLAWFYLCPVFYPVSMIPAVLRKWYDLNPMVAILEMYRAALLGMPVPAARSLLYAGLVGLACLLAGTAVFVRLDDEFPKAL
jgi:ABC-2 type transport system permease protein